jgi:hypothetical protein
MASRNTTQGATSCKGRGNNFTKPKNVTHLDLYRLEIWPEGAKKYILIRDCSYNEITKIFTQIDDMQQYSLYEVHEWVRQKKV